MLRQDVPQKGEQSHLREKKKKVKYKVYAKWAMGT